jgi:hypothetical protein
MIRESVREGEIRGIPEEEWRLRDRNVRGWVKRLSWIGDPCCGCSDERLDVQHVILVPEDVRDPQVAPQVADAKVPDSCRKVQCGSGGRRAPGRARWRDRSKVLRVDEPLPSDAASG